MSLPTRDVRTLPPPPPAADVYRPLSPLAMVGMGLAFFSLLIFVTGSPALMLFLVIPGLVVSWFARRQIRQSDGTLAGKWLTTAGIVLSLTSGLGWAASYLTDYLIVYTESSRYLDSWLTKLSEGRVGEAFLDTLSYNQRRVPFDPNDIDRLRVHTQTGMGSPYDGFRGNPFVAMSLRYPKEEVGWTRLGWPEREYEKGAYTVKYRYALRTPEIADTVEIVLKAEQPRDKNSPKRPWKIELDRVKGSPDRVLTVHGEELRETFYNEAIGTTGVLNSWVRQMVTGEYRDAYSLAFTPVDQSGIAASSVALLLNPGQALVPTASVAALSSGWALSQAAPKMVDFMELYSTLHRDRGVQQPSWLLIKEKKDGYAWDFDVQCGVAGRELIYEFKTTLNGDVRNKPPHWQVSNYKFLSAKKKPLDPFGMR